MTLKKYKGIRKAGPNRKGNLGTVWIEQKDGTYKCEGKGIILTKEQIENDLRLGYLELIPS